MEAGRTQFAFTWTQIRQRLVFYKMAFTSGENTAPLILVQAEASSFGKDTLITR